MSFKRGMMHGICEVNSGKKIPIKWDVSNEEKGRHHWLLKHTIVSNTERTLGFRTSPYFATGGKMINGGRLTSVGGTYTQ